MKLALRVVSKNGTSYNGFQWPIKSNGEIEVGAVVAAPDWVPREQCGNGLHGWLHGRGNHGVAIIEPDSIWLAVEPHGEIINLDAKVKFESCTIRFAGSKHEAAQYVLENSIGADASQVIGLALTGDNVSVAALGTATAGDEGTATAGYYGTATAGDEGTATAGYYGTATAGDYGTATAGDYGTATAGYGGTATAGDGGTATAGYGGTATAGYGGTATAGDKGIIQIKFHDGIRYRILTGYVGEDGIEANVAYRVVDGKFVAVLTTKEQEHVAV